MATQRVTSAPELPVSLADVEAAHARIRDQIVRTPTFISRTLSELTGATVYLKFENLQFTAAYKERGALNTLLQLSAEARAAGVRVLMITGDHPRTAVRIAGDLGIVDENAAAMTGAQIEALDDEALRAAVRDHFATIGVDVVVDDTEGYAYLRNTDGDDGEEPLHVTVSIGVAAFPQHGSSAATLMRAADKALYVAKHAGRDGWHQAD